VTPAVASIEHYDEHLGETYAWMCGGFDAAVATGGQELLSWGIPAQRGDLIMDIGCGFGKHVFPLLALGARVHAIDSSRVMLHMLKERLPPFADVRIECGDIVALLESSQVKPDAIICLGDTLTHLPGTEDVARLLRACAGRLVPQGRLAIGFRDYSQWGEGETRVIEVRSEAARRVDCTLTAFEGHMVVEDTIAEQSLGEWKTRSHPYRKLRLRPDTVTDLLVAAGAGVRRLPDHAGMVRILAQMP